MKINWTPEQKAAVDAPVSNLLVTAAAGSGKTQVLTGRIIKHILDGGDISRLLIVTFTRAAAAEMRERITKSISDALRDDPKNTHLKKQMSLLPGAGITTIHSFCLELVRGRAATVGIDPGFKITDNADMEFMREQAAGEAIEKMYEQGGDFITFAKGFCSDKDDSELIEIILSVYKFAQSMPYPMEWLLDMRDKYIAQSERDFEQSEIAEEIIKNVRERIQGLVETARAAAEESSLLEPDYSSMFTADAEGLEAVLKQHGWDEIREKLSGVSWVRMPGLRDVDPDYKEYVKKTRESIKKTAGELAGEMPFAKEECRRVLQHNSRYITCICEAVHIFEEEYSRIKAEKNMLDLNDVEHIAIKILEDSQTAAEIMERYDEIYIDEYQDSNDAQEMIFSRISRENEGKPNVFMVGDLKQSIYGFRMTSPELFLKKKKTYSSEEGASNRKIALSKNFRSRSEVIDFVNLVFSTIMSEQAGGTSYDGDEALYAEAKYPPDETGFCKAEINIIDCEKDEDEESVDKIVAEARFVAKRIQELMSGSVYDAKAEKSRKIKYSDIVILMRSPKNYASIFEQELLNYGIPVFADVGTGYYETTEIRTFLALLSIIDNPLSDIPLLAVMRSPIFGFDEDELARIRMCNKNSLFKKAVDEAAKKDDGLGIKCKNFLAKLRTWRRRATYMPADELIYYLFNDTGYMDFVGALPSGESRCANLRLLFEKARRFEESSFRGLFNFLIFMQRLRDHEDMGTAKLMGEGQDVVRIMSIHKSKGLEFPVVFLSGTGKGFNKENLRSPVILHKELGFGIKYIDAELMLTCPSPDRIAVKMRKADQDMSEEIRVLYVALTRAKEKLIVTGAVGSAERAVMDWSLKGRFMSPRKVLSAKSTLELLSICAKFGEEKCVDVVLHTPEDEPDDVEIKAPEIKEQKPDAELIKRMEYAYAHSGLSSIPSKVSVTELKRLKNEEDVFTLPLYAKSEMREPRFLEKEKITAAKRGTYTHFVLQTIDIKKAADKAYVEEFINRLAAENILTEEAAKSVSASDVVRFAGSELGQRIINADKVYREAAFTIPVPASFITGRQEDFGENIILQGIIDCFFFEGDNIVLVDFKTDRNTCAAEIKKKYKMQMDLYALALEKKYFSKIYEKFIYLMSNGDIIRID